MDAVRGWFFNGKAGYWISLGLMIVMAWLTASAAAGAETPLKGCYARAYDKAHLARHRGQLVVRARLTVKAANLGPGDPEIAGDLEMWVREHKASFSSSGVCSVDGKALACNGSLSAAEADPCPDRRDGMRDCRKDWQDAGTFRIARHAEGVLVTIPKRLEIPETGGDAGPPFFYLSAGDRENNTFLLKVAECK